MIKKTKIGLAQLQIVDGDRAYNLKGHIDMIERAAKAEADVVVFPELSLTGYVLPQLSELALAPCSDDFVDLLNTSMKHDIIVVVGCPLKSQSSQKPTIGAVICFPNGTIEFYSKQYLHEGESEHCVAGTEDYSFEVNDCQIGLAICADFTHPEHAARLRSNGAAVYLVSALISEKGFPKDADILASIATNNRFSVLLSNHVSKTGGWSTCGNNSIWSSKGEVLQSDCVSDCLMMCVIDDEQVFAQVIEVC